MRVAKSSRASPNRLEADGHGSAPRERAAHLGPERRRPLVLDAAFELFLEHGYEGTSMDAIARAAGVTKPVVYACYPSKEELFKALLRREEERVLTEIGDALATVVDISDPETTLANGFTAFLRAVEHSPEAYRLIFLGEGGGNAALARRIQRGREQQVEAISALARVWLEALAEWEGPDRDDAARLLGHLVVGLAEGGARALLSDPRRWTPESLGQTIGRLAVRGQSGLWVREGGP
jgi:AcrR family transcriptional regulator